MARVVFMGTPEIALPTLEALHAGPHEIVAVYTQPDQPSGRGKRVTESSVKRRAQELGLTVMTPKSLKGALAADEMAALQPDAGVLVAYGKLLPQAILDVPTRGVLNLHPSLLPKYRGPAPIPGVILAGERTTGVTVMLVDAGMDSGPILAQVEEPVLDDDTGIALSERLAVSGAALMTETLQRWLDNAIEPAAQNDAQATYTKLASREDGRIDWKAGAEQLWRQVRAYQPWPGSFTFWRGARIEILAATSVGGTDSPPGTVGERDNSPITIATGDGALAVATLKPEGKRAMTAKEFVAGRSDFVGSRLPS